MTTHELVKTSPRPQMMAGCRPAPIVPQSLEDCFRLATAVVKAKMTPRGIETPEQAMVIIMRGLEVGLTPFQALDKIALVNGRPTIWGDGALALVLASGLCEDITERIEGQGDERVAICISKRRGRTTPIITKFSVEDAKRAGLWGKQGPWQQYQERMLQMRARAFNLRDGYADVLGGLYMREEFDITRAPRPSLASRMEELAEDMPQDPSRDPPHDPETGEIIAAKEPDVVTDGNGSRDDWPGTDPEEPLRQAALVREAFEAEAREIALSGRRKFDTWYNDLNPDAQAMLGPHMRNLMDAANKAGKK